MRVENVLLEGFIAGPVRSETEVISNLSLVSSSGDVGCETLSISLVDEREEVFHFRGVSSLLRCMSTPVEPVFGFWLHVYIFPLSSAQPNNWQFSDLFQW